MMIIINITKENSSQTTKCSKKKYTNKVYIKQIVKALQNIRESTFKKMSLQFKSSYRRALALLLSYMLHQVLLYGYQLDHPLTQLFWQHLSMCEKDQNKNIAAAYGNNGKY